MKILNKLKVAQSVLLIILAVFVLLPQVSSAQAVGFCTFPGGNEQSGYTQANCPGTWSATSSNAGINSAFNSNNNTTTSASSDSCAPTITNIGDFICKIGSLLKSIIPLLVALGVVYFVWGVVQFVIGDSEEAKTKGRDRIVFGLIGFVVIFGLWGLVSIVVNTFGISGQTVNISNITGVVTQNSGGLCNLVNNPNLQQLISYVTCIISSSVVPLIFALSIAMFVWGVVQYVINSSEEAKKEKGRQFMIWGVLALVVMVSVWGLVSIVAKTFNINVNTQVAPPKLNTSSQ